MPRAPSTWWRPRRRPASADSSICPVRALPPMLSDTGSEPSGRPRKPSGAAGRTWTIIRPTWVFGPRDVSLNRFVGFARRLGVVPMTNRGRQVLAPVFVDDVARLAADSLVEDAARNQVFELGGPESVADARRHREGACGRWAAAADPARPGAAAQAHRMASAVPAVTATDARRGRLHQPARDGGPAPLLERMPRELTTLEAGLRTYLAPGSTKGSLSFDAD